MHKRHKILTSFIQYPSQNNDVYCVSITHTHTHKTKTKQKKKPSPLQKNDIICNDINIKGRKHI
jgi:hypothetical protein